MCRQPLLWDGRFQPGDLVGAERDVEAGEGLGELGAGAGAHGGDERDLWATPFARAQAMASCTGVTPRSAARRASAAARLRFFSAFSESESGGGGHEKMQHQQGPAAGEEAAGQGAVRRERTCRASVSAAQTAFFLVRLSERVLNLQVADGMDLRGPRNRLDADLRETDVAHIAGLHHAGGDAPTVSSIRHRRDAQA